MTRRTLTPHSAAVADLIGPPPKPKRTRTDAPVTSYRIDKRTAERVTNLAKSLGLSVGDLADFLLSAALDYHAAGALKIDAAPTSGKFRIIRKA